MTTPNPNLSEPEDQEVDLVFGLEVVQRSLQWWIDFDNRDGGPWPDDKHITPPTWPSHGQTKAWIDLLSRACSALQSNEGGV